MLYACKRKQNVQNIENQLLRFSKDSQFDQINHGGNI